MTSNKTSQTVSNNGKSILENVLNPSVTLTFEPTNIIYIGLTIFAAITLSGLVVEGIKKLMR
ncbi:hypothetical protein [Emticicia sp. W12TSBA100-4]|uniref:hypothetical protein n=1 Tax=Emticicia sp. W12TSBA100-4 TaxID=3160965 RepID=UPI003305F2D4